MKEMPGPMIFLHYSWPCIESKLRARKISFEDFKSLSNMMAGVEEIKTSLLSSCFPKAVREMAEFRISSGFICDLWHPYLVRTFWRHYHKGTGSCAVKQEEVLMIKGLALVTVSGRKAINAYHLSLGIGDMVFIHQNVVIEKFESAITR